MKTSEYIFNTPSIVPFLSADAVMAKIKAESDHEKLLRAERQSAATIKHNLFIDACNEIKGIAEYVLLKGEGLLKSEIKVFFGIINKVWVEHGHETSPEAEMVHRLGMMAELAIGFTNEERKSPPAKSEQPLHCWAQNEETGLWTFMGESYINLEIKKKSKVKVSTGGKRGKAAVFTIPSGEERKFSEIKNSDVPKGCTVTLISNEFSPKQTKWFEDREITIAVA